MKLKKEYLILIVVIVALVLYLTMRSANHDSGELPQPAKLESAKINRLVVTAKEKAPLELVKKDEKWTIEPQGYSADGAKVKNMVNAIVDLTLTALVSESGNYDRYGLTAKERIVVQAFSEGKVARQLDVGKAAPTFQHTFVLLEGDPKVYHVRGQIEQTFDQSIESLRDKTVFNVEKDSITDITFSKGDQSLTLVKKEITKEEKKEETPEQKDAAEQVKATPEPAQTQWQKADGQAVDQSAIDRLLAGIARMDCDGYLDDQAKEKLTNAVWSVTFKNGQGEYTLSAFAADDEKDDKIPAMASTNPYAIYLTKFRVEKTEKVIKELLGIQEEKK